MAWDYPAKNKAYSLMASILKCLQENIHATRTQTPATPLERLEAPQAHETLITVGV